jgi:hypothetical protein
MECAKNCQARPGEDVTDVLCSLRLSHMGKQEDFAFLSG